MTDPLYRSKRWKRLREAALRRDLYQCQWSRRFGLLKDAQVVHHILPREQWPEYQWDLDNLVCVTLAVHKGQLHQRDGSLAPAGVEMARAYCLKRWGQDHPPKRS